MLYGGVRVNQLAAAPFPLQYIRSEDLPSPSLQQERHDLQLEMQMPTDPQGYNEANLGVVRQMGSESHQDEGAEESPHTRPGFHFSDYFSTLFHPERHQASSLPYTMHETSNVLGLRLFPLNMGVRLRVEAVRIRTEDLLLRLRDVKTSLQAGVPVEYPMAYHRKHEVMAAQGATQYGNQTLCSGSRAHAPPPAAAPHQEDIKRTTAHLRGGPSHPRLRDLSIFTRPQDKHEATAARTAMVSTRNAALAFFRQQQSSHSGAYLQHWMPLQMLKPMGHSWSASMRSSGVRGPSMQLMQERLDQKGFGWKRKSRSLWQQDTDTAGFRPHRYF